MPSNLTLVTGSAGRIGQAVVRELLSRGLAVRGFDIVPTPGITEAAVGDLVSAEQVRRAVAGVQTVIHLGATPDDDDFLTKLLPPNLIGTYNVVEAAREFGVPRVLLASSGQVVWWQRMRGETPIGVDGPTSPRGWYAATKCFLEAAGCALAEAHGRAVLAVRLGWVPRSPEHVAELIATPTGPDVYLSPGDAGRFFAQATLAPAWRGFRVLNAASQAHGRPVFDLAPARELIGYEPHDRFPEGVEEMMPGQ